MSHQSYFRDAERKPYTRVLLNPEVKDTAISKVHPERLLSTHAELTSIQELTNYINRIEGRIQKLEGENMQLKSILGGSTEWPNQYLQNLACDSKKANDNLHAAMIANNQDLNERIMKLYEMENRKIEIGLRAIDVKWAEAEERQINLDKARIEQDDYVRSINTNKILAMIEENSHIIRKSDDTARKCIDIAIRAKETKQDLEESLQKWMYAQENKILERHKTLTRAIHNANDTLFERWGAMEKDLNLGKGIFSKYQILY